MSVADLWQRENAMCPDCNHFQHDPGKCSSCNCGESELISLAENVEALGLQNSSAGWVRTDGYRAKPMRGFLIGEYGFE